MAVGSTLLSLQVSYCTQHLDNGIVQLRTLKVVNNLWLMLWLQPVCIFQLTKFVFHQFNVVDCTLLNNFFILFYILMLK